MTLTVLNVLTSALDRGEGSASRPTALTPPPRRGGAPRCLLNRRLHGPQSKAGCFGEVRNLLPLPELEPWTVQVVA